MASTGGECIPKVARRGRILITTPQILLECGNAASRRTYRNDVVELRDSLLKEKLLIDPTIEEIEMAWIAYSQGISGDAGIVDQISFAVMKRLGIAEAFTNDRHFKAVGFTTLF
jgi:predicted nucleic acid-binding protein